MSQSPLKPASVCSPDLGESWERQGQILTVGTKPAQPQFAGIGDFDVVWDWQQRRWFMVTSGMRGAASYDPSAAADTWKSTLVKRSGTR